MFLPIIHPVPYVVLRYRYRLLSRSQSLRPCRHFVFALLILSLYGNSNCEFCLWLEIFEFNFVFIPHFDFRSSRLLAPYIPSTVHAHSVTHAIDMVTGRLPRHLSFNSIHDKVVVILLKLQHEDPYGPYTTTTRGGYIKKRMRFYNAIDANSGRSL